MTIENEKVLLAVVDLDIKPGWSLDEIGGELSELISGCRGQVLETVFCRVDRPSPTYLIGEGKVQEIADKCQAFGVDTVIFSHDLKGSQQRNLEDTIKVKIIDRTQLILDIFARHATSQEGKMQVELAQLEYLLPRLVGQGVLLSRLGGGIGTLGPGETKLEMDRRRISQRIAKLKRQLEEIHANRSLTRKKRAESGIPMVSIVGYTNAGKSTLFNALTQAQQVTRDSLFTTLDSIARQYTLPNHQKALISDTVGFMQNLPHHLIESFKATLEQVREADLLLHVLDVTSSNFRNLYDAVNDVLKQLDAHEKPVITVLNKIDKLPRRGILEAIQPLVQNPVCVSALTGENLSGLNQKIIEKVSSLMVSIDVKLPINRMDLVHLAHKQGQVISVKYLSKSIKIHAIVPTRIASKFSEA